jgi:hypothetical protein
VNNTPNAMANRSQAGRLEGVHASGGRTSDASSPRPPSDVVIWRCWRIR